MCCLKMMQEFAISKQQNYVLRHQTVILYNNYKQSLKSIFRALLKPKTIDVVIYVVLK